MQRQASFRQIGRKGTEPGLALRGVGEGLRLGQNLSSIVWQCKVKGAIVLRVPFRVFAARKKEWAEEANCVERLIDSGGEMWGRGKRGRRGLVVGSGRLD